MRRNYHVKFRRAQRGSTILELSFVFIVFFAMLIAAFDFGQFLYIHQALVERARSAARSGVAGQYTDSQIQNLVVYGNTGGTGSAYFNLTTSMVTVTTSNTGTDDARTEVKLTNYPYVMLSPYLAGSYTGPNVVVDIPRGAFD
jgi:Flp pilus assembly protein TadG